jgi:hypothetical protein
LVFEIVIQIQIQIQIQIEIEIEIEMYIGIEIKIEIEIEKTREDSVLHLTRTLTTTTTPHPSTSFTTARRPELRQWAGKKVHWIVNRDNLENQSLWLLKQRRPLHMLGGKVLNARNG